VGFGGGGEYDISTSKPMLIGVFYFCFSGGIRRNQKGLLTL